MNIHTWQLLLTNILLALGLNVIFFPQSNDDCPDPDKYSPEKSLSIEINNKRYVIYEAINESRDDRFLVINYGSYCRTNKKSLLSTESRSGYATNFIKKLPNGFCYSFEYGNRYHYEYELYFRNIRGDFYLYKVIKKTADLSKNSPRQKITTIPVNNLSFDVFNVGSYLQ
ncbi:hypothetical protein [Spirosoma sp. KUDC1026]|uniref:hypothetical protein n=1 Tax=Spirosoma sp. KUDC1026 TaxID=2745947 RepID=UPI00159BE2AA|nr:hypothetical protein [Spirosoma sp. KUDC1026]QKZ11222.1 hypothetical protein HU175_00625 [Spirosoma sp. KUDC1026]